MASLTRTLASSHILKLKRCTLSVSKELYSFLQPIHFIWNIWYDFIINTHIDNNAMDPTQILWQPPVITILFPRKMSSFLTSIISALVFVASTSNTNIEIGKDDDIYWAIRRIPNTGHRDEKDYVITREDKGSALGQWAY